MSDISSSTRPPRFDKVDSLFASMDLNDGEGDLEERKGEPIEDEPPASEFVQSEQRMKTDFDAMMAKLDADPSNKNMPLNVKQKTVANTLQLRYEMLRINARAKEVNERRAAGKEKAPASVKEALFGEEEEEKPAISKRQKRKNKKRADALPATMASVSTMEKVLVENADIEPQERVKTEREKHLGRRNIEKQNMQELYLQRMKELDHHVKQWLIRERATYLRVNPNASEAEAEAKFTVELARKFVTWEKICEMVTIADIQDRGRLTPKQQNEAQKILKKREEETKAKQEEQQRTAEESMSPEARRKKAAQDRNRLRLHQDWIRMSTQQHENRRELRLCMAQQLLLQRSVEWHAMVQHAFQFGVPMRKNDYTPLYVHRDGDKVTPDHAEAKKDEDGKPELARRPPLEKAYIEFYVEEESIHQFSADWNPLLKCRIIGLSELEWRLAGLEKQLPIMQREDPMDTKNQLANWQGEEEATRNLVREVKTCNMHTHFVMCVKVACDTIPTLRGMGVRESKQRWCKIAQSVCTYDLAAQDKVHRAEVNAIGPIKTPLRLCGYDGAYCLAGTPVQTGGKIVALHEHAQCTIKTCSKPECAEAGEPDLMTGAKRPPVFCSDVCKRRHVESVHDTTAVARRAKANKLKKQHRRERRLAAEAADAAAELARTDTVRDETEIAEAICAREEKERQAEKARQDAMLGEIDSPSEDEEEEEERKSESEADEEIEV